MLPAANMLRASSRDFHFCLLPHYLLFFLSLLLLPFSNAQVPTFPLKALNNSVSAIFVFGDSTVDPGNNNYVTTAVRSNFPPYGRDFVDHVATGRFTNGKLVTDIVASYVGIKESIPPYLDPTLTLEEMMTGVSFASAGCGYDPLTSTLSSVIQISTQLENFRECKSRIELAVGKEKLENLIKNAVFVVSAGTNDFLVNYFALPIRFKQYTVLGYQRFLLLQVELLIQNLREEGAQRIAIVGLPPFGCLPIAITLRSATLQRRCIGPYCTVARDYNRMLQDEVKSMQMNPANRGALILYLDIYSPLINIIQDPIKFGFDDVSRGCCGTGLIEAASLCNPEKYACPDASKYVFWDSVHPTERTYSLLFEAFRSTVDSIIKF